MIGYPTNQLLAVLADGADEIAVRDQLARARVGADAIRFLKGDEGIRDLDAWGRRNGISGRLYRWIQFMAMDATPDFERYEQEVQAGRTVIAVRAPDSTVRARVVDVLRANNASFVNWYGRLQTALLIP